MQKTLVETEFGRINLTFDGGYLVAVSQSTEDIECDVIRPDVLDPVLDCIEGRCDGLDIPVRFHGTAFQVRVWETMRLVPPGEVVSYSDLAKRAGNVCATRAVASACGQNPCVIVVPCHRIVRRDKGLGGFAWGLPMKRALLAREGVHIGPDSKIIV